MASLFVRAHWADEPPPPSQQMAPEPAWANQYPGTIPRMQFTVPPAGGNPAPPSWPGGTTPVPPSDRYHVWVPLVRQSFLDSIGTQWSGPNWAGPPPPPWPTSSGVPQPPPPNPPTLDQGYSATAVGYQVSRLRLFQDAPPGGDFTFTVIAPNGTSIGTVNSANGWTTWLTVPASVTDGKGFWTVIIDRAVGSAVAAPALLLSANAVNEPYVSPYGDITEGILGVEFDGIEITAPPPITATPIVSIGACNDAGHRGPSVLQITFAPPLPVGSTYTVAWFGIPPGGIQNPLGGTPGQPATVMNTPLPVLTMTVALPPGTYYPGASLTVTPPGGLPQTLIVNFFTAGSTNTVVVESCPPPPPTCHDIHLTASSLLPCIRGTTPVSVTLNATITAPSPTAPPFTGPVSWQVRNGNGALMPVPPDPITGMPPSGSSLTYVFSTKGTYEVTASITRPGGCVPLNVSDAVTVSVVDCDCPTFTGSLIATRIDGCTFSFSAQVTNPTSALLTYRWDFGSGPDPTAPNSPQTTHTFPSGTTGQRTVTLTVTTSTGCSDSITTQVNVDCGMPGDCPQITGSINATESSPCTFNFSIAVMNPAGRPTTITWNFGDGATATGASTSHTYGSGGPFTVTATMTSPGCPDRTATTTVSCSTMPPGSGGGGSCICDVLLWLAFILFLAAAVLAVLAVCYKNPYIGIAAGILFVLAWIAYGLWAWLCARISPNSCRLLNVLECVITWIIAIVPILALIIGFFTGDLLCGLAVLATELEWGLFLVAINETKKALGCPPGPSCFGIPSPPTSPSSSGGPS